MSLDALYHKEVLRLAASAAGAGRLQKPGATIVRVNPICGDKITVDVTVSSGKIVALGYDAKACVLCQASAAVLGHAAVGQDPPAIATLAREAQAMLREGGAPPSAPFGAYAAMAPAAAHKSRHACILMPIEALIEALETTNT